MKTPQPRLGTYVTYGDREYQANSHPVGGEVTIFSTAEENPDPAVFSRDGQTGRWVATVRTADCARVASVTTRATWKGELCSVMSISDDGDAVLYHLGNNRAKSAEDGFRALEPGNYARTVPVIELDGYHEYHADLTFDEWWRTEFASTLP